QMIEGDKRRSVFHPDACSCKMNGVLINVSGITKMQDSSHKRYDVPLLSILDSNLVRVRVTELKKAT
ncbi:hypothetical protein, partial [Xylella fastidiosa]|uniref:hypothetical protein n=1 Tax=Xylella fastidiosa TaxID=2371 RepID=UPI001CA41D66